jgi:hypothetical protein
MVQDNQLNTVFPVVMVPPVVFVKCTPGANLTIAVTGRDARPVKNAIRFAQETGSRKISIVDEESNPDESIAILVEVLSTSSLSFSVKIIGRLEPTGSLEMNLEREFLIGRFSELHDSATTEGERLRAVTQSVCELLRNQIMDIGESGKDQLSNRLSEATHVFGSMERNILFASTSDEVARLLTTYRTFERFSFLIMQVITIPVPSALVMLRTRDTLHRIEILQGMLRQVPPRQNIIRLTDMQSANTLGEVLRFHSKLSTFLFIIVLLFAMYLKGSGYFDYRYR